MNTFDTSGQGNVSLGKRYSSISASPGFNVALFTALKGERKGKAAVLSLMVATIYIHKQTEFNGVQIHGSADTVVRCWRDMKNQHKL